MQAGAYGLSVLSDPLDAEVLRVLGEGALPLAELRQTAGLPPQTTLRKHLKALTRLGLLVRTQPREFPAAVTYELSPAGHTLRAAARSVEHWLETSPFGPLPLGRPATKSAIKSLVDAWTTKMLRGLAVKPLSLTELDRLLAEVNYPALERRLTAMRLSGQVEATDGRAGGTPYRVTRWLREAVGPLAAAAHWESTHGPAECEPLGRLDVEALFLLAMPLVRLPPSASGTCSLVVDISNGKHAEPAGVTVSIEEGRPVSCASNLRAEATATAFGPGSAWLASLSPDGEPAVRFQGEQRLAEAVVAGLRRVCLRELPDRLAVG